MLIAIARSAYYIRFSMVHYYLLPTRLSDEDNLSHAIRDVVRIIRAKIGDDCSPAWPLSHRLKSTFSYGYTINLILVLKQSIKFNGECDLDLIKKEVRLPKCKPSVSPFTPQTTRGSFVAKTERPDPRTGNDTVH